MEFFVLKENFELANGLNFISPLIDYMITTLLCTQHTLNDQKLIFIEPLQKEKKQFIPSSRLLYYSWLSMKAITSILWQLATRYQITIYIYFHHFTSDTTRIYISNCVQTTDNFLQSEINSVFSEFILTSKKKCETKLCSSQSAVRIV